jgi:hypothetical protein
MKDANVVLWLVLMLVAAAYFLPVAIIKVFLGDNDGMHWLLKAGFGFMTVGCTIQIVRSLHYIDTGAYPVDVFFPTWITKDIGYFCHVYYYAFVYPKEVKS